MVKLGEGTYGCAYYPSLTCKEDDAYYDCIRTTPYKSTKKQKNDNRHSTTCKKKYLPEFYENKISKATTKLNAKKEIKEQKLIDSVDPSYNYHFEQPTKCMADNNENNRISLQSCNVLKNKKIKTENVALLIIKNGGDNLKQFVENISKTPAFNKHELMVSFWKESIKLIYALRDLSEKKVLHYDLKPQNIVYDINTNKINMIDFGLSRKFKSYGANEAHFSYPPETYILETKLCEFFTQKATDYDFRLYLGIVPFNESNTFMHEYSYFLEQVTLPEFEMFSDYAVEQYGFLSAFTFLKLLEHNFYKNRTFEEIKNVAIATHDMYGLGLSYMYVLIRTYKFIENDVFIAQLYRIILSMIHPNCFQRPDINILIKQYENALQLLRKLKRLNNHFIQEKKPVSKPPPTRSKNKKIHLTPYLSPKNITELDTKIKNMLIVILNKINTYNDDIIFNNKYGYGDKIKDELTYDISEYFNKYNILNIEMNNIIQRNEHSKGIISKKTHIFTELDRLYHDMDNLDNKIIELNQNNKRRRY
jgi:serine/threonine protein kinase